ncbi:MAG: fibronectin type III domain-containing protein [Capsulimonadaceae bacterium]|nr:fibronectin type III domain-containing protein [Capsulimonadaceae bacterium]
MYRNILFAIIIAFSLLGFSGVGRAQALPAITSISAVVADATTSSITLSWSAPSGATTGVTYNIYRGTKSTVYAGTPVGTASYPATTFIDSGLTPGTQYFYVVTSVITVSGTKYESLYSTPEVSEYTLCSSTTLNVPTVPISSWEEVDLSWTAVTGAASYNVYREATYLGEALPQWTCIKVGCLTTKFVDDGINDTTAPDPGAGGSGAGEVPESYSYYVTVNNQQGTAHTAGTEGTATLGLESNTVTATANGPVDLTAVVGGNNQAALTWTDTDNALSYNIYRATSSGNEVLVKSGITAKSYTDTGLASGTWYYYRVTGNYSTWIPTYESGKSNEAYSETIPIVPANLTAVGSNAQILLSWTICPNAIGYNLYRSSTSSGGPWSKVTEVSSALSSCADSSLTPGQTYWYYLTSLSFGGESAPSNVASATVAGPTNLIATPGNAQVLLNWSAATGASTYYIYRTLANGAAGSENSTYIATATSTSYTDQSVTNGDTYYYEVSAETPLGAGAVSNEASATPAVRPAVPTDLVATPGIQQVALSWNAPVGATGSVTYTVYRGTASGGESLLAANITSTTYSDTGLSNNQIYYYYVTVTINGSESLPSNEVYATTPPAAPTGLTAQAQTGPNVLLNWNASAGATSYNILRSTASGSEQVLTSTTPATVTATTYTDTTVSGGTTYYYEVQAVNSVDASVPSASSAEASATTVPSAPTLNAPVGGNQQIILSWSPSVGATGYNVYCGTSPGSETKVGQVSSSVTTFTNAGLSNGTTYYYEVTAYDAGGESVKSNETSAITIPAAPINLSATGGATSISLTWTASTGASSYNIYRGTSSGGEVKISTTPATVTSTTYSDTSVTSGDTYFYEVTAVNNTPAESSRSNEVSVSATTTPSAPSGLSATVPSGGLAQVVLAWSAPSTGTVATYNIYRSATSTPYTWTQVTAVPSTSTGYTDSSVSLAKVYYYEITAVNGSGVESSASNVASATTPLAAPTGLTATGGTQQVVLAWTAVSGATSYDVYRSLTSGGEAQVQTGVTTTSYTDSSLTPGTTYYYEVTAVYSGVESARSTEKNTTTIPAAPSLNTPVPGIGQVGLSWTPPSSGPAPSSYNIYRSTTPGAEVDVKSGVTSTSYADTTVSAGTTYYYEVTAVNAGVESPKSAPEQSATTYPAAPSGLVATGGQAKVSLTWTASTGASSYNIFRGTSLGGEAQITTSPVTVTTTSYTDLAVSTGTVYYYYVTAVGASGQSSGSNEQSATTAPAAPTLAAPAAGNGQVVLSWSEATGQTVTSFNIYRGLSAGGESTTPIASTSGTSTTYTDTSVTNGATYYYYMTAVNSGGESPDSTEQGPENPVSAISAPTLALGTPAIPLGGAASISLSWTAGGTGTAATYNVYQSLTGIAGSWSVVASVLSSATSYTVTGLSADTLYHYYVTAVTSGGSESSASNTVSDTTPTTAPAITTITGGSSQVSLTWTRPTGATSFNLYRSSTGAGGEGSTPYQSSLTALTFTDTSVSSGSKYYYYMTAVNVGGGESAASAEKNATTIAAAPTLSAPVAGNGQVALSWTETTGQIVSSYNIYRGTASGGESSTPLASVTSTSTTYTDTTVANGTQYWYFVTAVNAGGESGHGSDQAATPSAPTTPTALNATGGNQQVLLTWTAPAGSPASYNIYRSLTSGGEGTTAYKTGVSSTSYTDSGLTNNTQYFYEVTAVYSGAGESAKSTEAAAWTLCAAPTLLAATAGNGQIGLSWTAPTGGASSYDVFRGTSSGAETSLTTVTSTNCTDSSGLANGTTYYYYVTAVNGAGVQGPRSNEPHATPSAAIPANLTATAGNATVTLAWTAVSGATAYNIYRSATSGGEGTTATYSPAGTATTYADSAVTNGTANYEVTAITSGGESAKSNEANATPLSPGPTSLVATPGNQQVSLTWTAPTGATGSTTYSVYRGTSSGGEALTPVATSLAGTTYVNSGLTNGTTYYYEVTAVTSSVESAKSNEASAAPVPPAPTAPTNLSATGGYQQVALTWTAGSGASSYSVYRGTVAGGEAATPIASGVASTSFTDNAATDASSTPANNLTYYYTVIAVNSVGVASSSSNEAHAMTLPGPPTGLNAVGSNQVISLTWTAPSGGVSGYSVFRGTASGGESFLTSVPSTVTNCFDTGVSPGTTYYYYVTSLNSAGGSSTASTEAHATASPAAPVLASATAVNKQVTLVWAASTGATSYNVYRGTTASGESATPVATGIAALTYVDTSLTDGTTYFYEVTAVDAGGESLKSNELSATPTPGAPTNLIATAGNQQVLLTWTAGAGAATYNIYRGSTSGGEGTTPYKTGVATASYTDTGLTDGTTYYYTVTAVNVDESAASNEAHAAPAPNAPAGLSATGGSLQVSLSWTASAGAVTYNVYRGTTSGGESATAIQTGLTSPSYLDTGLTAATQYFYKVTAVNVDESAKSAEANTWTFAPVPTGLLASAGNKQVSLTWNPSGGATSYNIYRGTTSGGEGSTAYKTGVTTASYADTSVNDGTKYFYTVTAVDAGGESAQCSEASATPVPDKPTNLISTPGNQQVVLAWTAGAGAVTYNIYRGSTSGGEGTTPYKTGVAAVTYTDSGLTDGTTYYYTVTAVNVDESAASNETSAEPLPNAPTGLTATAGEAHVSLSWTASAGAVTYNVYRGTSAAGEAATPVQTGVTGTTYNDPGLTDGQTYYYKVTAVNTDESSKSNEASATPLPDGPTGLIATGGVQSVLLNWTASVGATSYKVYRGASSGGEGSTAVATVTSPTYTDPSLSDGTTYYYKVTAVNGLETAKSNEANAITMAAVPTILTAAASNQQVSLTWTTSTGATSYNVYRGTTSGGESATPVATGQTTGAFTDSGLTDGTTYYYEVTALDNAGESAKSQEAPAKPAPSTPTGLTATGGAQSVSLSWTAPAGASTYNVYRGTTLGGESSTPVATGVPGTTYVDSGLADATKYFYKVTAVNGAESGQSGESSATTYAAVPSILTATGGAQSVSLTWTASTGATSYNVYRGTTLGGESATPVATGLTSPSYLDTSLSDSTKYYYEVSALDAGGESGKSAEAHATTFAPAPTGLTATPGNQQIVLNWNASSGATSYNVYRGTTLGGEGATAVATVTSPTYTDPGLTDGTTYFYKVTAVLAGGESAKSNEATAAPLPDAPAGLSATAGNQQVSLTWTASAGAVTYNVYRGTTAGGEGATPYKTGVATASYTDTGLTDGTPYYYKVTAVNVDESGASNETSATPLPDAPSGLTATSGSLKISLSWTASAGALTYNVYRGTAAGAESATPIATGVTSTSYTDTGLSSLTTYYYKVSAVNVAVSAKSNEAHAKTVAAVPTGLSAVPAHEQISLTWTAVTGATSYNVYRGTSAGGEAATPVATGLTTATYTDTSLADGIPYYYKVTAVDGDGESAMSSEATATTFASVPTGLTATPGNQQITLAWTASTGAVSYKVYRGTTAGGEAATPVAVGLKTCAYVDTGLTNGTTYYYTVTAVDAGGESGASNEAHAAPVANVPSGLTATAGNLKITLSWTASAGAATYNVYRGTTSGGESATAIATGVSSTSYVDTGLTAATQYFYTVTAVNVDESAPSNEANATTFAAAPTGLTAVAGSQQVSLTWTASSGAASYKVYRGTSVNGEAATAVASGVTATSYTDTSLTDGTTYYYKVSAVGVGGEGPVSSEASATPLPDAPTGLTATAGNLQVSLSWTVSVGALTYNVYRGTSANGESSIPVATGLTAAAKATTVSYNDTGLSDGTTYYYKVTAVSGVESAKSNEASAKPLPVTPVSLTATAGDQQVVLSWSASTGAVTYKVYRGTTSGGEASTAVASGVTSTGWTDTTVTNTKTYYYYVTAINGAGESPASNEASATPFGATNLTATAAPSQVTLSWTSAGSQATGYNLYRGTAAGGEASTPLATLTSSTTSYVDNSANSGASAPVNGTTYYYYVTATTASGQSAKSNEASATPEPAIPSAPTGLTATAGYQQVLLSWTAAAGAVSYNVYAGTTSGAEAATPVASVAAPSVGYTQMALTNGQAYYYQVTAVNGGGESAKSSEATATPEPPSATAPTFSPVAGTYTSPQTVTITDSLTGAAIYYTTDGTTPTTSSTLYKTPIAVSTTTTINAIAIVSGFANSSVSTATFTIQVPVPAISPDGGSYVSKVKVSLTDSLASATLLYTIDGSNPATSSTASTYSGAFYLTSSATVNAVAKSGAATSAVASAAFTIQPQVPAPSISPAWGTYYGPVSVTITDSLSSAKILYTTDDSDPATSATAVVYSGAFTVSSRCTVTAVAIASGYANSAATEASYTLVPPSYTAGLSFFSCPYDYPGIALDTLFGYTGVKLATWSPGDDAWYVTPNGAANAIRLGQGYWARFPEDVTLTSFGTSADITKTFAISLTAGWNMIGDPFATSVALSSTTYGSSSLSFASASSGSNPLIWSTVYSYSASADNYVAATSLAPLLGYWIYAYQSTTMYVPY